jgi:hypothetical protein
MGDGAGAVFTLLDREDKHRVHSVNTGAVLLTRPRRYRNELGFMIINSCGWYWWSVEMSVLQGCEVDIC